MLLAVLLVGVFALDVNAQDVKIPVKTPSAKQMAKRYLKYGKIEIVESDMEKIEGLSDEYGGIRITGTAKYTPAKFGKDPFEEITHSLRFNLYNEAGLKVTSVSDFPDCGENGQDENVEYKEPFPFVFEDKMIPLDKFNKVASHKVDVWYILQ
ncbi:MAG: hypothetical protein PF487_02675 [Bacteroidales bacterium]|nr:hypothetical protein [Bacteroidales bacterium]